MLTKEQKLKIAIGATKIYARQFATLEGASEKAIELAKLIGSLERSLSDVLKKCFELVIGEDIPVIRRTRIASIPCAVCVPLSNPNSHNYEIGKPAMFLRHKSGVCLANNGNIGNDMCNYSDSVRPATETEIKKFFDEIPAIKFDSHTKDIFDQYEMLVEAVK